MMTVASTQWTWLLVQRFFIGVPGNYANVGKCFFIPASSPYPNLRQDQLAQSYSVIVVGDVL
jgi:hypothetical protein